MYKKWEKYLDLINQLYFVFDSETYEKYEKEILEKIDGKAGIYVYNTTTRWLCLRQSVKFTQLPMKNEEFYRKILFNYLFRKAMNEVNRGNFG